MGQAKVPGRAGEPKQRQFNPCDLPRVGQGTGHQRQPPQVWDLGMAQRNWWEDDAVIGGPAPATAPSFPGVIPGRPRQPTPTTPVQAENLDISRERLRLAQEAEARAAAKAAQGDESERTAGFLAGRVVDAVGRLTGAVRTDSSAASPTLGVEAARKVFGDTAANYLTDEDRQVARAAQIDIIDAALTLGTGAAYTQEQIEGYREAYFPQLGDSPATIESKREALRSLLENAQTKAGRAAPDIAQAIAALDALDAPERAGTGGGDDRRDPEGFYWRNFDNSGNDLGGVFDEGGNPLGPDGGLGFDAEGNQLGMYGRMTDDTAPTPIEAEAARIDELAGPMGITDLAGHGISLGLTDEAAGIGTVISSALTGDFDVVANYQRGRDVEQYRIDQARERFGAIGTAAEILGGGALARANPNQLMQAGRTVAARGVPVTRSAILRQTARQTGREGALAGFVGGFGYGEGLEGSATGALVGAGGGAVLGYGAQRLGNAFAGKPALRVSGVEVQQAADDLAIPLIPAVTGGTTARRLTSGARQGFISDRPISRAVDRMEAGGEAARNRTASATGRVLDSEEAGDTVRQAANVYSRRTSNIGGQLYRRADRMAAGEKLPLPDAIQAAAEEMEQLAKGPGGTESALYRDIAKLREQMAAGSFEVDGIRAFRSRLRNELTERGLRGTPQDVAFSRILQAAEDDMISGLQAAGKANAAGALRTAAAFWRKRVETIDEVLEPVIGRNAPRSGEQIVSAIERLAHPRTGNSSRLRQLFQAMPKDEARSVSATLISRMGRPTAGAAEKVEDGGFSFTTFLTNWNNMSGRAKAAIFPQETRQALDKLATVSRGVKQAGSAMNTSNTAGAVGVQALISGVPWLIDPLTAVGVTGGQWMVGRLLASPRLARWIASAPKNPKARGDHIARLGGIARAEPAISNEIGLLQRALAANDNAAVETVAAEEPEAR